MWWWWWSMTPISKHLNMKQEEFLIKYDDRNIIISEIQQRTVEYLTSNLYSIELTKDAVPSFYGCLHGASVFVCIILYSRKLTAEIEKLDLQIIQPPTSQQQQHMIIIITFQFSILFNDFVFWNKWWSIEWYYWLLICPNVKRGEHILHLNGGSKVTNRKVPSKRVTHHLLDWSWVYGEVGRRWSGKQGAHILKFDRI